MVRIATLLFAVSSFAVIGASSAVAAEGDSTITLGDGKAVLVAPESWVKKEPRTNIVEYEFEAPAAEGDDKGARITVMGAGGGVEANIDRWVGQFTQPDGTATSEKVFKEKTTVGDAEVHVIDISGTFKDQMGPFAPATQREGYRMIAGIVSTEKSGDYFIKMYGPRNTVEAQSEAFRKMMKEIKVK